MIFLCYEKCTTCQKAQRFLDEAGVAYTKRSIREERPTREELERWRALGNLPLRRLFNTSGQLYRALELKDRLPQMSEAEQLELLASDGMLVKRPMLIGEDFALAGFKEAAWREALGLE